MGFSHRSRDHRDNYEPHWAPARKLPEHHSDSLLRGDLGILRYSQRACFLWSCFPILASRASISQWPLSATALRVRCATWICALSTERTVTLRTRHATRISSIPPERATLLLPSTTVWYRFSSAFSKDWNVSGMSFTSRSRRSPMPPMWLTIAIAIDLNAIVRTSSRTEPQCSLHILMTGSELFVPSTPEK